MSPIIIGVIIALVVGIVYLSSDIEKKDSRKKHLDGMIKLLKAQKEEVVGRPNSYALRFVYRKTPFLYEDIEEKIFEKVVYRGFLRLNLPIQFNIVFTENISSSFRSAPVALVKSSGDTNQIDSPRGFKEFAIFSNKPDIAQKLFEDDAVVRVFAKFKNKDVRGKAEMALDVVDGVAILKFYPLGQQLDPTIFDLRNNVSLIEDYLEDLLIIYRQVKKIADDL